jgi:hypothetical protein
MLESLALLILGFANYQSLRSGVLWGKKHSLHTSKVPVAKSTVNAGAIA